MRLNKKISSGHLPTIDHTVSLLSRVALVALRTLVKLPITIIIYNSGIFFATLSEYHNPYLWSGQGLYCRFSEAEQGWHFPPPHTFLHQRRDYAALKNFRGIAD